MGQLIKMGWEPEYSITKAPKNDKARKSQKKEGLLQLLRKIKLKGQELLPFTFGSEKCLVTHENRNNETKLEALQINCTL